MILPAVGTNNRAQAFSVIAGSVWISFLLCSCSVKTDYFTKPLDDELRTAVVFDDSGNNLGCLQQSKKGDVLYWIQSGRAPIEFGSYKDEVKQTVPSPDNSLTAVIYTRNCGATTDWATRMDIFVNNQGSGKDDNRTVFIMKGLQSVTVEWKSSNILKVYYPSTQKENIFRQHLNWCDKVIEYHEKAEPADKSQYLELANFNYGLTGISAGIPEQTLLRMAGWAQEKSGLTQNEWGKWYDNPPYGDNPKDQEYIKQGIIWFHQNRDKINGANKK